MRQSISRRQFLRGLGGFTLAMPFLPSLAHAQAERPERRFVAMTTAHGGLWGRHFYPDARTLTDQRAYAGHTIRSGRLQAQDGQLSPILSARGLDAGLAAKLNVLRGIDIPYYIAHHRGGHLGNFADNDGNGSEGAFVQSYGLPTIDQVMAWSPAFHRDLSRIRLRSIVVGQRGISWNWSRPSDRSGRVQPMATAWDPMPIFNRLFNPSADARTPSPLVVDRVHASYRRLMERNPRISVADRRRVTEHMDRLFELERRLRIDVQCAAPEPRYDGLDSDWGDAAHQVRFWQAHTDIVAAALACGVSRVAVLGTYSTFSDFVGDWHQDIAHQGHLPEQQQVLVEAHQRFFEQVFIDLARKLDAIEEPGGGTVLDHTLMAWSQESGMMTHDSYGIPIVTAGGAGGALQTGWYVDYRDQDIGWLAGESDDPDGVAEMNRPGLYYNQWLGTALGAMGVDTAEYAAYSRDLTADYAGQRPGGYGIVYASELTRQHYAQAWQRLGEGLPIVTRV